MIQWHLAIHGGAGRLLRTTISATDDAAIRAALAAALDAGGAILAAGGTALDAVEAALHILEDAPQFNSGRGASLTHDGTVELDAAIMDGRDRNAGAVAGITGIRHPVSLARAVMERSPHVLLSGAGAEAFAAATRLETAPPDWFVTPARRRHLDELRARGADAFDVDMKYGTVGAVARDAHGHLAAATSTGGVTGKRWGRIGDSPIPGAGTYADDRSCAVSCTGSGEFFLRAGVAAEIAARVRLTGESLQSAADAALADVAGLGGSGGAIVVGRTGAVWSFNTAGMHRGMASATGARIIGIYGDE